MGSCANSRVCSTSTESPPAVRIPRTRSCTGSSTKPAAMRVPASFNWQEQLTVAFRSSPLQRLAVAFWRVVDLVQGGQTLVADLAEDVVRRRQRGVLRDEEECEPLVSAGIRHCQGATRVGQRGSLALTLLEREPSPNSTARSTRALAGGRRTAGCPSGRTSRGGGRPCYRSSSVWSGFGCLRSTGRYRGPAQLESRRRLSSGSP